FIKSNPDSYYAAFTLNMRKSYYPLDELQSYYDLMTERVKNGKDAKEILAEITKIRSLEPGNPAPVFATIDINGNPLSLSDFKGKYVILDFWASWCVPCRKSNPHLKALYEKYKDKGLEVICISDDDSKPDKWREAVEKDQIGMFKHVLRGLKILPGYKFDRTNDISEPYAVHSLPTKFLIDRNGNMVGKVTSEELEAKLKEVFGE
ncbi:MAG: TlpA disulfide reductase family protein, partial [Bacteroidales bacterium]|nr:TlpA disulfide reductase family protein [Bacteroidales bacterium]